MPERILTASDLNAAGVAAALVGFLGFTIALWATVWHGMGADGQWRPVARWWLCMLLVSFLTLLWGLLKA